MLSDHKPRDIALLDALDALPRVSIREQVWRTVRDGRDPLEGGKSRGRWGHDGMETLYTAQQEQGAVAEVFSFLSLQPVFPSKVHWATYEIQVNLQDVAVLPSLSALEPLGLDVSSYRSRDYSRTQEIGDAALFLGFSGLMVPSARWDCINLVIFTERAEPGQVTVVGAPNRVDWDQWREHLRAISRARS